MYFESHVSASMRERKKLACHLELKSMDNMGRFAGYASVFNVVDNQRDVVVRGAFSRTVKGRVGEIKLLWQHQQDEPIGVFEQMFEDSRGLYVEGKLLLGMQRAQEAHILLKAGALSGLSIGYSPLRYTINSKSGVRTLSEVELWEVSLVTFPANDAANVTVVKSAEPQLNRQDDNLWNQALRAGELIRLSDALDKALGALSI